mgnify:CR=1 FL=1
MQYPTTGYNLASLLVSFNLLLKMKNEHVFYCFPTNMSIGVVFSGFFLLCFYEVFKSVGQLSLKTLSVAERQFDCSFLKSY